MSVLFAPQLFRFYIDEQPVQCVDAMRYSRNKKVLRELMLVHCSFGLRNKIQNLFHGMTVHNHSNLCHLGPKCWTLTQEGDKWHFVLTKGSLNSLIFGPPFKG